MTQTTTTPATRSELYKAAVQIKQQKEAFGKTWPKARNEDDKDIDRWLETMHKFDADLADLNLQILLHDVNANQRRLRDMARLAFDAERPTEDITTNDGSFHATKVKKYPKLQELKCRGKFSNGNTLVELNIQGERFSLANVKNGAYSQPDEITPYTTFEEMLQANGIEPQDITIDNLREIIAKCKKINEEMKQAIEKFSRQKDELRLYHLSNIGLFDQRNSSSVYEYNVKTVSIVG